MASSRIHHEDQENRVPDLRQKNAITNNIMGAAVAGKRPVLGVINSNKPVIGDVKKPVLKEVSKNKGRKEKENRRLVNPVVPVAQFEAFKVYEDDEYAVKAETIYAEKEKPNSLEETKENVPISEEKQVESSAPMGIEKPIGSQSAKDIILRNKNKRDEFFEIEEYRADIYAYLREHELLHRAKSGYIRKQPDVTENMRAILVDWLVEVTEEYRLQTETLHLAVNYIDRFLSYMSVVRGKLQLVGTSAMFIAAKYEEIFPPEVNEFVYITDDTYEKCQVIRMEHLILRVLGFDLSVPTALTFINHMCISTKQTEKTLYLAMYLSELAMLQVEPYLEFLPSIIAASALALARHTLGESAWTENLYRQTGYQLKNLKRCIYFLLEMFAIAPTYAQHAIQDKYKHIKYLEVSKLKPRTEEILFN